MTALAPRAARTTGTGDTAAADAVKIARATTTVCINALAMDAPQSEDGNFKMRKDGERLRAANSHLRHFAGAKKVTTVPGLCIAKRV